MRYDALQDASFNSWGNVERADAYDGADGAAPTTANGIGPRLVGADNDGPRLETQNTTPAAVGNINEAFLHVDSSNGLSVTGLHATDDADGDSIYTPDTTANYAVSTTEDIPLSYVWGYDAAATSPANAAATALDIAPTDSTVLAVIKLDQDVDIAQAISYIYRPDREQIDTFSGGVINNTVVASGNLASAVAVTYSSGARVAGEVGVRLNDTNNGGFSTIVVELPAQTEVWSTDVLVVQNILNTADDTYYSIHIKAPVATATTVNPGTTEPNPSEVTDLTIYKQVFLGDGTVAAAQTDNIAEEIRSGLSFGVANADYSANAHLQYREEIDSAAATWAAGTDDDATDADQVNFTTSTTDSNGYVTVVLDPVAAGSVNETVNNDKFVGNDATLTVTATDFSGKPSIATITLQKGHGSASNASNDFDLDGGGNADDDNQEIPILNIISGSAID
jgi:hypothetical protein